MVIDPNHDAEGNAIFTKFIGSPFLKSITNLKIDLMFDIGIDWIKSNESRQNLQQKSRKIFKCMPNVKEISLLEFYDISPLKKVSFVKFPCHFIERTSSVRCRTSGCIVDLINSQNRIANSFSRLHKLKKILISDIDIFFTLNADHIFKDSNIQIELKNLNLSSSKCTSKKIISRLSSIDTALILDKSAKSISDLLPLNRHMKHLGILIIMRNKVICHFNSFLQLSVDSFELIFGTLARRKRVESIEEKANVIAHIQLPQNVQKLKIVCDCLRSLYELNTKVVKYAYDLLLKKISCLKLTNFSIGYDISPYITTTYFANDFMQPLVSSQTLCNEFLLEYIDTNEFLPKYYSNHNELLWVNRTINYESSHFDSIALLFSETNVKKIYFVLHPLDFNEFSFTVKNSTIQKLGRLESFILKFNYGFSREIIDVDCQPRFVECTYKIYDIKSVTESSDFIIHIVPKQIIRNYHLFSSFGMDDF